MYDAPLMPQPEATPTRAQTASNLREEVGLQLRLMVPLLGTYLADLCLFYIDHAIVGRLGAEELGAVGLSGMVFFELIIIASAILSVVGVIVGNAHGAGDMERVARAVRKGLVSCIYMSVPVMVMAWFLMDLVALTDQDPTVIELGEQYVRAALWMVPPSLGFVVLRSFVTGLSRPGVVTLVITLALPVNLALNYVLVFGKLGIPALGVAGAGYASAIVGWLMFFGLVIYVRVDSLLRRYEVFKRLLTPDRALSARIWQLGLPVAGLTVVEGSFFNLVIIAVGLFGAAALAANQIVINVVAIAWTIGMSIGEAAAVRVSQEVGNRSPVAAFRAGWLSVSLGLAAGFGFFVLLLQATPLLAGIFIDPHDPENAPVMETIRTLALLSAIMAMFDCVQVVAARCLRGLEDTWVPMLLSAAGYWVIAFPLGLVLAFGFDLGLTGLWLGFTTGVAVTAMLMLYRWYRFASRGQIPPPPASAGRTA